MIQFEKRSARETYGGNVRSLAPRHALGAQRNSNSISLGAAPHGAPIGRGVPIQEKTPHYSTYASAAFDPHPAIHNPLLPFGKFTQTVIDGLAVFACLVLICATGVGLAVSVFILFFVKT